jgi:hypothetical protein
MLKKLAISERCESECVSERVRGGKCKKEVGGAADHRR